MIPPLDKLSEREGWSKRKGLRRTDHRHGGDEVYVADLPHLMILPPDATESREREYVIG